MGTAARIDQAERGGRHPLGPLANPDALLKSLRQKNLQVTLGQEIRLTSFLARFAKDGGAILNGDEAVGWMVPLIATNRENQAQLASAIREWWNSAEKSPRPRTEIANTVVKKIGRGNALAWAGPSAFAIAALAIVLLLAYGWREGWFVPPISRRRT